MNTSYDDIILSLGAQYDVGINDGTIFKKVRYIGTKQHFGKPMLCFKTENKETITVNPSYNSFCIEQGLEQLESSKGEENNG